MRIEEGRRWWRRWISFDGTKLCQTSGGMGTSRDQQGEGVPGVGFDPPPSMFMTVSDSVLRVGVRGEVRLRHLCGGHYPMVARRHPPGVMVNFHRVGGVASLSLYMALTRWRLA